MKLRGAIGAGEAARQAGISRERLLRAVQRGDLDGRLIGGRWMIGALSLRQFIQRSQQESLERPAALRVLSKS